MRNFRPLAYLGLFLALVLLASLVAWMLVRFGTPQPALVDAGDAKDYLPGQAPRLVFSEYGESFYVLNLEESSSPSRPGPKFTPCAALSTGRPL